MSDDTEQSDDKTREQQEDTRELPSPSSPMLVAQILVDWQYPDTTLRYWRGDWWSWDVTHWTKLSDDTVRAIIYQFTSDAKYLGKENKSRDLKVLDWNPTQAKVSNVLDALKAIVAIPDNIESPTWLSGDDSKPISVENGLLDVDMKNISPHSPNYFNQITLDYKYDPAAECPQWITFLDELWSDDLNAIKCLQEIFGYIVKGDTNQHKIFMIVGPPRAGKGVIIRILTALVGEDNVQSVTFAQLKERFGKAHLIGASIAVFGDARLHGKAGDRLVGLLLSISGMDKQTIDQKNRPAWCGTLSCRFFITTNELPALEDTSGALLTRIVLLTLKESWLGREDLSLSPRLLEELPGILNWALVGAKRLDRQESFTPVASSGDAMAVLHDMASPAKQFIRDRCLVGPKFSVEREKYYNAYNAWAKKEELDELSHNEIKRDLMAVVPEVSFEKRRVGKGNPADQEETGFIVGIKLKKKLQ